jgi:hypothetical protein
MSGCRFMYQNQISTPAMLKVSSARPGLVGLPVPKAWGSAVAYAQGLHSGDQDQVFRLEIDSLAQGQAVGQATYRWQRADSPAWEETGVPTGVAVRLLADGVGVKWVSGQGQDFCLGDAWTILAGRAQGAAALLDSDRDTAWQAQGCQAEHLTVDLGQPARITAVILADHNLSDQAQAVLLADPAADWEQPAFAQPLALTWPHLALFLDHACRHWRLSLADPANPQGAIQAGGLYLGGHFAPARTFGAQYVRGLAASRALTSTDAGKTAGCAKALAQAWSLAFNGLDETDLAGFEAMFRAIHDVASGRLSPLWFTPFDDQPAATVYCLPGDTLEPSHQYQGRYSLNLNLQEMVRSRV